MSKTSEKVAEYLYKQALARRDDPRDIWGIPWGLKGLDKLTGGIQREELSILMARPGVGKTTLMEQFVTGICEWMTTPDGINYTDQYAKGGVIRIVSVEMTAENFQSRITSKLARVSQRRVREGNLRPDQFERWVEAAQQVAELPIEYLDDTSGLARTERFLAGQERPDSRPTLWWGLDYIQIHPTGQKYSQGSVSDISMVASTLRDIAKSVAPGLVLSQMNRDVDKREDRRPTLPDLKGSGTLEEAGSLVMGLYREDVYKKLAPEEMNDIQPADLGVLKQRSGPNGTVKLAWHPLKQWFEDKSDLPDLDDDDEDAA